MDQFIPYTSSSKCSHINTTICEDPSETYDVSKCPELFTGDSLLELCNSFWMQSPNTKKDVQPYLRGCKWSPDGTCCLSVVNRDGFHIMELPRDLYEGCPTHDRMISVLPAVIHVKESGLVYDFCWYPKMNSHYPETCSWISTKINSPIQMWDAYNGTLRCSYRGYNAVDEMEPAISVTFINQGERIVGGYKNCLRTFDVERPGRDFLEHKIKSPASCFATKGSLLAVGSWNASIKLFSFVDSGTYRSVGNLHAHTGGITHLQFTPDGTKLVSGARKDHSLCVWDVRYHRRPLNILKRSVSTNQRIYFDISTCGRYLVSGGTDGVVRVWDNKFTNWMEQYNQENATFRFRLYSDCCNSISIHPSRPILATGSGQFHFLDPVKIMESEYDNSASCVKQSVVEPQSMSNGSSDELSTENKTNVSFSVVHKPDFANVIDMNTYSVKDNTSSEVHKKEWAKEFSDKITDHNIAEESLSKIIALGTCSDSPPAKRPKWSYDAISSTVIEKIENPVSTSIMETCNMTYSDQINTSEERSTMLFKMNVIEDSSTVKSNTCEKPMKGADSPMKEEHIAEELNIDVSDKPTSQVTKDSSLPIPILLTIKQPIDSISTCDSESSTEEYLNSDADRQLAKLCDTDRSPIKTPDVRHIENPPGSKCILNNTIEFDDDYNDTIENKIKYSSYAENNLTFWWIAKIFGD